MGRPVKTSMTAAQTLAMRTIQSSAEMAMVDTETLPVCAKRAGQADTAALPQRDASDSTCVIVQVSVNTSVAYSVNLPDGSKNMQTNVPYR